MGAEERENINLNANYYKPNSVTSSPTNGLEVSTFFKDEGWRQSNGLKWKGGYLGLENIWAFYIGFCHVTVTLFFEKTVYIKLNKLNTERMCKSKRAQQGLES